MALHSTGQRGRSLRGARAQLSPASWGLVLSSLPSACYQAPQPGAAGAPWKRRGCSAPSPRQPSGLTAAPGHPSCCRHRAPRGAMGRAGAGGGSGSAWGWAGAVLTRQPWKSLGLAASKPASGEQLGLFTVFLLKEALRVLFQK